MATQTASGLGQVRSEQPTVPYAQGPMSPKAFAKNAKTPEHGENLPRYSQLHSFRRTHSYIVCNAIPRTVVVGSKQGQRQGECLTCSRGNPPKSTATSAPLKATSGSLVVITSVTWRCRRQVMDYNTMIQQPIQGYTKKKNPTPHYPFSRPNWGGGCTKTM